MVTNSTVKQWVHSILLGLVLASLVLVLVSGAVPSTQGKLGVVLVVAGALWANLATIFKKADEAIDVAFPPRRDDGGFTDVRFWVWAIVLSVASVIVWAMLFIHAARADVNNPALGRCFTYEADGKTCKVSERFSGILPVVALNLATGAASGGVGAVPVGVCHGVTYKPAMWWASGVDLCAVAKFGTSSPNSYGVSFHIFAADYGSIGIGPLGQQVDGKLVWQWWLFFSGRLPVQ